MVSLKRGLKTTLMIGGVVVTLTGGNMLMSGDADAAQRAVEEARIAGDNWIALTGANIDGALPVDTELRRDMLEAIQNADHTLASQLVEWGMENPVIAINLVQEFDANTDKSQALDLLRKRFELLQKRTPEANAAALYFSAPEDYQAAIHGAALAKNWSAYWGLVDVLGMVNAERDVITNVNIPVLMDADGALITPGNEGENITDVQNVASFVLLTPAAHMNDLERALTLMQASTVGEQTASYMDVVNIAAYGHFQNYAVPFMVDLETALESTLSATSENHALYTPINDIRLVLERYNNLVENGDASVEELTSIKTEIKQQLEKIYVLATPFSESEEVRDINSKAVLATLENNLKIVADNHNVTLGVPSAEIEKTVDSELQQKVQAILTQPTDTPDQEKAQSEALQALLQDENVQYKAALHFNSVMSQFGTFLGAANSIIDATDTALIQSAQQEFEIGVVLADGAFVGGGG